PVLFTSSYLGAIAGGTPVAPLDPRATADELAERASILALTDIVGDRLDAAQTEAMVDAGARVWSIGPRGPELVADSFEPWGLPTTDGPQPSVVLATSGSTGRPKLVPLHEDQLVQVAAEVAEHHGFTREDRGYCPLPLFHINAQVVGVLSTLLAGSSLVLEQRFARDDFWEVALAQRVTWLNLVPAILASVTPSAGADTQRIRFARSASSPLSEAVRGRFEAATGIGVLETYGMTEAASQIAANPLAQEQRRAGSVGQPIGVELRVSGPDGRSTPPGETGEIRIRGRSVIDRYLTPGRIDSTPARDADGWLRTGDLGILDGDGFLRLVGRTDDVINRGGEKVYPREIEEVLLRDERVSLAVATSRPHASLGSQPVAFVATSLAVTDRERLAVELTKSCEAALSRYKRPAEIFVTDELPVGATGKVARQRLAEVFEPLAMDMSDSGVAANPGGTR
ncbi:MAG: AMP-binding protein, partial [Acidimicrobiales bacterium]